MPPERNVPGSPADWLARARGDLLLSQIPLPEGAFYEDLCYHAQQAVEKAVKAVYRAHHLEFRYTHDLAELLDDLKKKDIDIPPAVYDSIDLTEFATEARYPGFGEPVTGEECKKAVMTAKTVVQWAENKLRT